jgi:hypothetical protein
MPDQNLPRVIAAEGVSNFGSLLSRLAALWALATLARRSVLAGAR